MLTAALKLLTSKAAGPVATGVALALAVSLGVVWVSGAARESVLTKDLTERTRELAAANSALTACHGNVSRLDAGRIAQNAGLEKLKTESQRKVADAEAAAAAARAASAGALKTAAIVMAKKPGEDLCASADALILESLK